MRRKVIGLLISVLALSGVVGIGLAQAGGDNAKQNVQQVEADDAQQNESSEVEDADAQQNESSEVEDADEPGDDDGPGEEAKDD